MLLSQIGMPKKTVTALAKKHIYTIDDLLRWFPRKYRDYRETKDIMDCRDGEYCAVAGKLKKVQVKQGSKGKFLRLSFLSEGKKDEFGNEVWFRVDMFLTAFLLGMVVTIAFLSFTENSGTRINIPEGLGKEHSYVAWQLMNAPSSAQYKLREETGMNFDSEGFGVINDRYVIACTDTYGMVGDRVDFHKANGQVIHAVIGDIKNRRSPGCNIWGDRDGQNIIEFVVDKDTWYTGHVVPGSPDCHPEWDSETVQAVNFGKMEVIRAASAK